MKCSISYHDQNGETQTEVLQSSVSNKPDIVDYILLSDPDKGFTFPTATYGLTETEPQITLTVATTASSSDLRKKLYDRTMRIDCIMLVPHGISNVNEERFEIAPHGDGDIFQWRKY